MSTFPEEYLIAIEEKQNAEVFTIKDGKEFTYEAWREAVLSQLRKIAASSAGLALLRSIQASKGWILIKPLWWKHECNAHGREAPAQVAAWELGYSGRTFTGLVAYDPQVYMSGSECYKDAMLSNPRYNRGGYPDEVLFHELIHAYRKISNEISLGGGLIRYTSDEEFFAVVLTNIYISDATNHHKSGLRADHTALKGPLEKELSGSYTFFQSSPQVPKLIERLMHESPFLCHSLAQVKACFNPLAAYSQNRRLATSMSHSSLATQRERTFPNLAFPERPEPTIAGTMAKLLEREALGILRLLP
jgi:hypothetical protein